MVTSSPSAGAPLGLQLAAVVQRPPAVGTHVFTAALAVTALPTRAQATMSNHGNPVSVAWGCLGNCTAFESVCFAIIGESVLGLILRLTGDCGFIGFVYC